MSSSIAFAQTPEDYLGLPYNSVELSDLRNAFTTQNEIESFLPYQKVYKIDYQDDGVYMEYNSDVALYRIAFFDTGYTYKAYKQTLPFNVKWNMTLAEVEKITGLLDFTRQNIFIRNFSTEDYSIDFYFTEGRLHHIKMTSTLKRLKNKAQLVANATGIRLLPDGTVQDGNTVDGTGSMIWGNGAALYKGEWSYGLPHGKGQYIDSFGNRYDGEFKLGFFWGEAKFFSKIYQYSYNGEYVMGKKHNKGKIVYSNRTVYSGDWVQDVMHGEGKYATGPNFVYKGSMVNNTLQGKGEIETPDGFIRGYFANGKPHGICTQETKDGSQSVKGNYTYGKKNGVFTIKTNGQTSKITYENDIEIAYGLVDPTNIR